MHTHIQIYTRQRIWSVAHGQLTGDIFIETRPSTPIILYVPTRAACSPEEPIGSSIVAQVLACNV